MLAMIEKLINEHGSSVILKERLELINDKYETLQEKLENSEKENELLKKENSQLSSQIAELQEKLAANETQEEVLSEVQQKILKLLFDLSDEIEEKALARQMNLDNSTLKYHMDSLSEKKLTSASYTMGNTFSSGSCFYGISKIGRKYVVEEIGT